MLSCTQALDPSQSGSLEMPPGSTESFENHEGRVIECRYDEECDTWIMRQRDDDKSTPNADLTYFKVCSCSD